ncbi:acyl-CoA dehydrogenase family protein [Parvibaculum sp.]|uniref:acyl-CoA dehydrogenase family protein n=1 Tax=Parvibaculum sp. TaxID=2024848 RepID=UPI00391DBFA2
MDLAMKPEDVAFRDEVRAFLKENLIEDLRAHARLTPGILADQDLRAEWLRRLYKRGWAAPSWPKEYGGAGFTVMQRFIWASECAAAGAPAGSNMGLSMVGPTLMGHGTDEQKAHYLPRILDGTDWWCQGYSEPGSGSDLASLQCRAVSDGDDYIINGTKLWTTGAHQSNKMFCLVRTDTSAKPQEGISFILIDDFPAKGIKIDPIITLAGDHEVNQVFFDDVRVPKKNRVGAENNGWTVAKYLLEFERGGAAHGAALKNALNKLRAMAAQERDGDGQKLIDDPAFRRKVDEVEVEVTSVEFTEHRIMSRLSNGQNPGAAASIIKLKGADTNQKITELGVEAIAYYAQPDVIEARTWGSNTKPVGPDHTLMVMPKYLNTRAQTIFGGSNEVQRNIMAKAVLGL